MATPTSGVNTPALSSQLWSVRFIPSSYKMMTRMRAPMAAAPKRSAPYCWTLPDWTGRRACPPASARRAGAVDRAVDAPSGRRCVDPLARPAGRDTDAVHDAVEHGWLNQYASLAIGPLMPAMMTFS